jgi:hypothetical protein
MHHCTDEAAESAVVYEPSPSESLSEGVVAAVAAASNCDPLATDDLDPLATVLDPDALDSIFETVGSDTNPTAARVTFRYHGHEVTVERGGRITVVPASGDSDTDCLA